MQILFLRLPFFHNIFFPPISSCLLPTCYQTCRRSLMPTICRSTGEAHASFLVDEHGPGTPWSEALWMGLLTGRCKHWKHSIRHEGCDLEERAWCIFQRLHSRKREENSWGPQLAVHQPGAWNVCLIGTATVSWLPLYHGSTVTEAVSEQRLHLLPRLPGSGSEKRAELDLYLKDSEVWEILCGPQVGLGLLRQR